MADLLTHVLAAYIVVKLLGLRYGWITAPYVTMAMVGAVLPDLNRVRLLVDDATMTALLGVPWSWGAQHRLGGVLISVLIICVLVSDSARTRVFVMLSLGAGLHLFMDLFLHNHPFPILWPLTTYRPPFPGLYSSSADAIWMAPAFVILALLVWIGVNHLTRHDPPTQIVPEYGVVDRSRGLN